MDLGKRYEWSLIKTKILNIACQLESDHQYTKEKAIQELENIVDLIDKLEEK